MTLYLSRLDSENPQLEHVGFGHFRKPPVDHTQEAYLLMTDPSKDNLEKTHALDRFINQLNHSERSELLIGFLEKSHSDLLEFLSILRKETRQFLFQGLANFSEKESFQFFSTLARQVVEGPLDNKNKMKLIHLSFGPLTPIQLQETASYLYNHLEPNVFYPFLCLIYDGKTAKKFLDAILSVKPSNMVSTYRNFIENLSKYIQTTDATLPIVLHQALQFKLKDFENNTWQRTLFIDGLFKFSSHAIHCILWCADPLLRHMIAKKHNNFIPTLVSLLIGTVDLEPRFGRKMKLIHDFISHLKIDQLDGLTEYLKISSPTFLSYIPCALSNEAFEEFFSFCEYNEEEEDEEGSYRPFISPSAKKVTATLSACEIERDLPLEKIAQKLTNQNRLTRLLNERSIAIGQESAQHKPSSPYPTMREIKDQIEGVIKRAEDDLVGLSKDLASIPPYLLALSMYEQDREHSESPQMSYREFIDKCMPYWNAEQLKAIGRMISSESREKCYETIPAQLSDIITTMPESDLKEICEELYEVMVKQIGPVKRRFNMLNIHLELLLKLTEAKEKEKELTKGQYEDAAYAFQKLNHSLTKLFTPLFIALEKEISTSRSLDKNDMAFKCFLNMRSSVNQLQAQIQKQSFPNILQELRKRVPPDNHEIEEDLFGSFSEDFLSLLTQEMVKNLELEHPSGDCLESLGEMGIKSKEDLKLLGYTKEQENAARLMRLHILDACLTKEDPHSKEPENAWNELFFNSTFYPGVPVFIDKFHLLDLPIPALRKFTQILIADYEKLETLDQKTLEKLTVFKAILDASEGKILDERALQEFRSMCQECLHAALHTFYSKDITVLLKLYLDQCENRNTLKEVWKKFNQLEIFSLSDLKKKKELDFHDFFHLKKKS